jgi:hypothetical protein
LTEGRHFSAEDKYGGPGVAIANHSAARLLWGRATALNHLIGFPSAIRGDSAQLSYRVVGVVGDVKVREINEDGRAIIYLPIPQHEPFVAGLTVGSRRASLIVRTSVPSAAFTGPIAKMAQEAGLSIQSITTVAGRMNELLMPQRLGRTLLSFLGAMALALTVIGVHGLLACVVARQTKEIGIRLALGAGARDVVRLLVVRLISPVVSGLAAGAVVLWFTVRYAQSFMYGTSPSDPLTIAATAALILASAIVATLIPARRALSINPIDTLRTE